MSIRRTVLPSDEPLIEKLMASGTQATMSDLVTTIVDSRQFRYRRDKAPDKEDSPTRTVQAGGM